MALNFFLASASARKGPETNGYRAETDFLGVFETRSLVEREEMVDLPEYCEQ